MLLVLKGEGKMTDKEMFWELIDLIGNEKNLISEKILKEVGMIVTQVQMVSSCSMRVSESRTVDYKKALNVLKDTLRNHFENLPQKIREKI